RRHEAGGVRHQPAAHRSLEGRPVRRLPRTAADRTDSSGGARPAPRVFAPIVAVAPPGLVACARRARGAAVVSVLIALYFVLLNAGYTYWEGGWSFGPRHLAPGIPFACLWLGPPVL